MNPTALRRPLESAVTHRFDLSGYGRAIRTVREDATCLKAVIEP